MFLTKKSFIKFESKKIVIAQYKIYGYISSGIYIIPPHYQPKKFEGDSLLWILPINANDKSFKIICEKYTVNTRWNGEITIIFASEYIKTEHPSRPPCDFFGNFISLEIPHGPEFMEAYAYFYWDNIIPQIAERTMMRDKLDIRDGYVLSTLQKKSYAGTYPAVDHEFHIKGRFAVGGKLESNIIRRMLELQMKIMREDKRALSRNVCAIQPNRSREYDVWRGSQDRVVNAQMFRITANIEFVENMARYYSMTKDITFIKKNIEATEKNCSYIESFIEKDNLLNSHVYYEDQVMKDGKVAQAQCFAINSLRIMAKLEKLVGNTDKIEYYEQIAEKLATSYVKEFPNGFWDSKANHFIDWIDSKGNSHDHIHLLANELPCLFGITSEAQRKAVEQLNKVNDPVFSKFPSFVAAKIEDYTPSEIGSGGPYDLCAAGRYWCWDATYKASIKENTTILRQLQQVMTEAKKDHYLMGERYDMDYVFYIDGKTWHGSALYFEYPNVFFFVLITQYLGIQFGFETDLILKPIFIGEGSITLPTYGIKYTWANGTFTVENYTDLPLSIDIDLAGIGKKYNNRIFLAKKGQIVI